MASEEALSLAMAFKLLALCVLVGAAAASPNAADVFFDMYATCLKDFSVSCVKPKAMKWINQVASEDVIGITDDLQIVKDPNVQLEEIRGEKDIFDRFDDFLSTHRLIAKVPQALQSSSFIPRALIPDPVDMPLVEEGRGKKKYLKKLMIPFLLGLKFKTAVLVPLALALIALKTWKAMTLGLLSMVLTGAMVIFKFTKPKVVNYEVVHYPHHVDHHVEHAPAAWDHGYGRELGNEQIAYRGYQ